MTELALRDRIIKAMIKLENFTIGELYLEIGEVDCNINQIAYNIDAILDSCLVERLFDRYYVKGIWLDEQSSI